MTCVQIGECRLIHGDVLESLAAMPAGSVQCCVTSPPYWGLRDYQTAVWEGGDAACDHKQPTKHQQQGTTSQRNCRSNVEEQRNENFRDVCGKCGAKRIDRQIGLEPTPEEFIAKMVAVFAEVRRVLRDDGTLWLNLGTSYYRDLAKGGSGPNGKHDFIPDYGNARKQMASSGVNRPNQPRGDALACGSDDTELLGSQAAGRACPYCGGELRVGFSSRRAHTAHTSRPAEQGGRQPSLTDRDSEPTDSVSTSPLASPGVAARSKKRASSRNAQAASDQATTASASHGQTQTSFAESPASVHTSACIDGTGKRERPSEDRTLGKALFCVACGYCNIAPPVFKPKDLLPIPWMVAMALQQDGWYLRSVICWAKKSPMPESVTDRPTSSWEPIFLMAKSERYFFDAEAVKEPAINEGKPMKTADGWDTGEGAHGTIHRSGREAGTYNGATVSGRNQRNVWHLGPEPCPLAHFATFPTEIPRRAIKAGTSEKGCCPKCGAPWRRVTERTAVETGGPKGSRKGMDESNGWGETPRAVIHSRTLGWQPGCECDAGEPVPCVVLDPFLGSGTSVAVAVELNRVGVGIELNGEYLKLACKRIEDAYEPKASPLFGDVAPKAVQLEMPR